MTRGGTVLVALAVLFGGALTACSSDDTAPAPTSVPDSVVAPTTERVVASTVPSTTSAPTTTLDPATQPAAEVETDLLEAFRLGREASQDPFNIEKEQAALDRRLGVIAESFATTQADYRDRNYAIRPNEETPSSVTVEGSPEFFGADDEVAEVQICEVNSWILVEVGAGPNGTDAIVNPDIVSYRSTVFMRNVDGVWRFEGGDELDRWEGSAECPPE